MDLIVDALIEIPRGSSNKYEYDEEKNVFMLDRVLYSPMFYLADYGFIPETLAEDGDPLDIMVLTTYPTFPGCIIEARVIGMLLMEDEKGKDEKVVAVPVNDPRYDHIKTLDDMGAHIKKEFEHFFSVYKDLEEKEVKLDGWADIGEAARVIDEARKRY